MQLLINIVISSLMQVVLINIVPFLWWLFTGRKKGIGYFKWVGLKLIPKEYRSVSFKLLLVGTLCFAGLSIGILFLTQNTETSVSQFYGLGIAGLLPALIYAIIQTSLTEEILFRGFLLKRLGNKFNFAVGNLLQSIAFGLLHGVMFFSLTSIFNTLLITAFTGIIAYFMGYINEKKADGSIVPSWCIHALSNILASAFSLFSII